MYFVQQPTKSAIKLILGGAMLTLLIACSSDSEQAANSNTQVAAKVNEREITIHQLNGELSQLARQKKENFDIEKETPAVLERTINQELYIQQAETLELNRRPEVLQALEQAKRQVLAQAYVTHIVSSLSEPAEHEIAEYYEATPSLFSDRKIYQVQQIVFDPAVGDDLIREKLATVNSLKEISDWTQAENIRINTRMINGTAEQIPMNILPLIYQTEDDKGVMPANFNPPTLFWRMRSQDAPLTLEQATPFIKQYLSNKTRMERVNQETKQLRTAASIEYKGEFANTKPDTSEQTTVESGTAEDMAIEKGLKGL